MNSLNRDKFVNNIAIVDFDGTLTKHQSQSLLIKYLYEHNYINLFDYIYILLWFIFYKLDLVKNPEKALKVILRQFVNKPSIMVDELVDKLFDKYIDNDIYPNAKGVSETLRSYGYTPILMSSATEPVVKKAANVLGFSDYFATELKILDGILTGELKNGALYNQRKIDKLTNLAKERNFDLSSLLVMTDHHSDIPLLEMAKIKIPTNPDKKLLKWSKQNNIPVLNLEKDELVQYFKSNSFS